MHVPAEILVFLVLVVASLPSSRVRRAILAIVQSIASVILPSGVILAAIWYIYPSLEPQVFRDSSSPLGRVLIGESLWPGHGWLLAAMAWVILGYPALILIDFARRLAGLSSAFESARNDIRQNCRMANRLFIPSSSSLLVDHGVPRYNADAPQSSAAPPNRRSPGAPRTLGDLLPN